MFYMILAFYGYWDGYSDDENVSPIEEPYISCFKTADAEEVADGIKVVADHQSRNAELFVTTSKSGFQEKIRDYVNQFELANDLTTRRRAKAIFEKTGNVSLFVPDVMTYYLNQEECILGEKSSPKAPDTAFDFGIPEDFFEDEGLPFNKEVHDVKA